MHIYDLDGTLRDVTCCNHLIVNSPKPVDWAPWCEYAAFNAPVITSVMEMLYNSLDDGNDVVILTSSSSNVTTWLERTGHAVLINKVAILERGFLDERTPFNYKVAFIESNYESIDLWIDGAADVCNYVRCLEIPTVQVLDGEIVNLYMGRN